MDIKLNPSDAPLGSSPSFESDAAYDRFMKAAAENNARELQAALIEQSLFNAETVFLSCASFGAINAASLLLEKCTPALLENGSRLKREAIKRACRKGHSAFVKWLHDALAIAPETYRQVNAVPLALWEGKNPELAVWIINLDRKTRQIGAYFEGEMIRRPQIEPLHRLYAALKINSARDCYERDVLRWPLIVGLLDSCKRGTELLYRPFLEQWRALPEYDALIAKIVERTINNIKDDDYFDKLEYDKLDYILANYDSPLLGAERQKDILATVRDKMPSREASVAQWFDKAAHDPKAAARERARQFAAY